MDDPLDKIENRVLMWACEPNGITQPLGSFGAAAAIYRMHNEGLVTNEIVWDDGDRKQRVKATKAGIASRAWTVGPGGDVSMDLEPTSCTVPMWSRREREALLGVEPSMMEQT